MRTYFILLFVLSVPAQAFCYKDYYLTAQGTTEEESIQNLEELSNVTCNKDDHNWPARMSVYYTTTNEETQFESSASYKCCTAW
jgi:hypothetical protein